MSLDLYIESKTKVSRRGTGVFVRDGGVTRELETIDEVRRHFPDSNISEIESRMYEATTFWHGNITHNLVAMANECKHDGITLYQLLWGPDENGFENPSDRYTKLVFGCYMELLGNRDHYEIWNPENGWGSYDLLLKFTKSFLDALMSIENYEDYKIEVSA